MGLFAAGDKCHGTVGVLTMVLGFLREVSTQRSSVMQLLREHGLLRGFAETQPTHASNELSMPIFCWRCDNATRLHINPSLYLGCDTHRLSADDPFLHGRAGCLSFSARRC